MSNSEMLIAISNMLEPIKEELHNLNFQMVEVKSEIKEIKNDIAIMNTVICFIQFQNNYFRYYVYQGVDINVT